MIAEAAIPTPWEIARRACPQALEASVIPAAILVLGLHLAGDMVAIGAAFAWMAGVTAVHTVRGRPVTGLAILSVTRLLVRSLVALATGSIFVYLVQGSIGGLCLASAFLASVLVDRPLARRFADDFCALPARVLDHPLVHGVLRRISLVWGLVGLVHALVGMWLLANLSTEEFVVVSTLASGVVPLALVAVSTAWFRQSVSQALHDGPRAGPVPAFSPYRSPRATGRAGGVRSTRPR